MKKTVMRFNEKLFAAVALIGLGFAGYGEARADAASAMDPAPVNAAPGAEYGDDQRPFQGIPGVAVTPGGRLWAVWYAGGDDEGPENYLVAVTSGDGGETWSEPRLVIDPPGDVRAYDPVPWVDPAGQLWVFYAQSYRWWDGRAGVWAVTAPNPDQANPDWSEPRRLSDGIMMNKPTILSDGRWLFPVAVWSHEPAADPKHRHYVPDPHRIWDEGRVGTHVFVSDDHGRTLRRLGTAKIANIRFEEHMLVERRDGVLWLLARTQDVGKGIAESFSSDGGRTWSPGETSSIPHVRSRFFIRRLASGRLLLVKHNPRMDTIWLLGGDVPNYWRERSHLTAYLSDDDGKSWYGGLLLDERAAVSYPDGDQAEDGRIYIAYDYNRKTDREILMAAFTEEDVAAGELVDPGSRLKVLINKAVDSAE